MKKLAAVLGAMLLALFMTACSQNNTQETNGTDNDQTQENATNQNNNEKQPADEEKQDASTNNDEPNKSAIASKDTAENQEDMKKMMDSLDFQEIELEISYGKNKEYEAEIEHHSNGDIEAEVEDELNGVDINDDLKAFNHIFPKAKKLKITRDTTKQEAIDQVLKAFDLDNNYEKFEAEFTFKDGTKLSFEDKAK